jgi:hypothetical protein
VLYHQVTACRNDLSLAVVQGMRRTDWYISSVRFEQMIFIQDSGWKYHSDA